ncbi:hypothetical protein [Apilactobacillus xinyiensis]|uniref:hypothetical protein n=1 Tax=Apilactobacillus xinyiensis TaxID=2841032 RepID=UPI0020105261|nr:hypothetical protein [Apilactobacillus xinyiensis]MCL0329781.1 hypothetical protein [Apilactobacillus xinyiensis]
MKKLFTLFILTFSIMLFTNTNVASAQSNPGFNSNYWSKVRKVKATKKVTTHLVTLKHGDWANNTKILKSKNINRGQIIKVQNGGASWGWIVSGKGFNSHHKAFWTMNKPLNTKWFKLVK